MDPDIYKDHIASSIQSLELSMCVLDSVQKQLPRVRNLLPEPASTRHHTAQKDIITAREHIQKAIKHLNYAIDGYVG